MTLLDIIENLALSDAKILTDFTRTAQKITGNTLVAAVIAIAAILTPMGIGARRRTISERWQS
jgi:hypothetical protein